MRHLRILYLFLFLFILQNAHTQNPEEDWISLFNGKDLDGWVIRCLPEDRGKQYWSAGEDFIEGNAMGDPDHNYVWLISEREFSDFHLKLEFQVFRASPGNSGVQFRSRFEDAVDEGNGGWMNGPQADIHGPAPWRTGMIYDETKGVQRWIFPSLPDWNITEEQVPSAARNTVLSYHEDDPDQWNTMEIICKDMKVDIMVNGHLVADFDGEGILNDEAHRMAKAGSKGSIAFQLHKDDELHIRYRNIIIKE